MKTAKYSACQASAHDHADLPPPAMKVLLIDDVETWRQALNALHRAKAAGRSRVVAAPEA